MITIFKRTSHPAAKPELMESNFHDHYFQTHLTSGGKAAADGVKFHDRDFQNVSHIRRRSRNDTRQMTFVQRLTNVQPERMATRKMGAVSA